MPEKVPKEAKAKRDGVINPQNYNFNQILTQKLFMLSNATNQPMSTVELGYMCPRGLTGPPAVTPTKKLKYKKRLLLRCRLKTLHHKSHFNTNRESDTNREYSKLNKDTS